MSHGGRLRPGHAHLRSKLQSNNAGNLAPIAFWLILQQSSQASTLLPPQRVRQAGVHEAKVRGRIQDLDLGAPNQLIRVGTTVNRTRARSKAEAVVLSDQLPSCRSDRVPGKSPSKCIDWPPSPRRNLTGAFDDLMTQLSVRQACQIRMRERVIPDGMPPVRQISDLLGRHSAPILFGMVGLWGSSIDARIVKVTRIGWAALHPLRNHEEDSASSEELEQGCRGRVVVGATIIESK